MFFFSPLLRLWYLKYKKVVPEVIFLKQYVGLVSKITENEVVMVTLNSTKI